MTEESDENNSTRVFSQWIIRYILGLWNAASLQFSWLFVLIVMRCLDGATGNYGDLWVGKR